MRKCACLIIASFALVTLGANNLATQDQALVAGAVAKLGFEGVPGKPGFVGGPQKFKVTEKTIKHLQALMKEGSYIVVGSGGEISVEKPAK